MSMNVCLTLSSIGGFGPIFQSALRERGGAVKLFFFILFMGEGVNLKFKIPDIQSVEKKNIPRIEKRYYNYVSYTHKKIFCKLESNVLSKSKFGKTEKKKHYLM